MVCGVAWCGGGGGGAHAIIILTHGHVYISMPLAHICSSPGRCCKRVFQKARLLAPQWRLEDCKTSGLEVQGITAVAVCCHRSEGCSGGLRPHGVCASQSVEAMVE